MKIIGKHLTIIGISLCLFASITFAADLQPDPQSGIGGGISDSPKKESHKGLKTVDPMAPPTPTNPKLIPVKEDPGPEFLGIEEQSALEVYPEYEIVASISHYGTECVKITPGTEIEARKQLSINVSKKGAYYRDMARSLALVSDTQECAVVNLKTKTTNAETEICVDISADVVALKSK